MAGKDLSTTSQRPLSWGPTRLFQLFKETNILSYPVDPETFVCTILTVLFIGTVVNNLECDGLICAIIFWRNFHHISYMRMYICSNVSCAPVNRSLHLSDHFFSIKLLQGWELRKDGSKVEKLQEKKTSRRKYV